jgi:hypothetical protein
MQNPHTCSQPASQTSRAGQFLGIKSIPPVLLKIGVFNTTPNLQKNEKSSGGSDDKSRKETLGADRTRRRLSNYIHKTL